MPYSPKPFPRALAACQYPLALVAFIALIVFPKYAADGPLLLAVLAATVCFAAAYAWYAIHASIASHTYKRRDSTNGSDHDPHITSNS